MVFACRASGPIGAPQGCEQRRLLRAWVAHVLGARGGGLESGSRRPGWEGRFPLTPRSNGQKSAADSKFELLGITVEPLPEQASAGFESEKHWNYSPTRARRNYRPFPLTAEESSKNFT